LIYQFYHGSVCTFARYHVTFRFAFVPGLLISWFCVGSFVRSGLLIRIRFVLVLRFVYWFCAFVLDSLRFTFWIAVARFCLVFAVCGWFSFLSWIPFWLVGFLRFLHARFAHHVLISWFRFARCTRSIPFSIRFDAFTLFRFYVVCTFRCCSPRFTSTLLVRLIADRSLFCTLIWVDPLFARFLQFFCVGFLIPVYVPHGFCLRLSIFCVCFAFHAFVPGTFCAWLFLIHLGLRFTFCCFVDRLITLRSYVRWVTLDAFDLRFVDSGRCSFWLSPDFARSFALAHSTFVDFFFFLFVYVRCCCTFVLRLPDSVFVVIDRCLIVLRCFAFLIYTFALIFSICFAVVYVGFSFGICSLFTFPFVVCTVPIFAIFLFVTILILRFWSRFAIWCTSLPTRCFDSIHFARCDFLYFDRFHVRFGCCWLPRLRSLLRFVRCCSLIHSVDFVDSTISFALFVGSRFVRWLFCVLRCVHRFAFVLRYPFWSDLRLRYVIRFVWFFFSTCLRLHWFCVPLILRWFGLPGFHAITYLPTFVFWISRFARYGPFRCTRLRCVFLRAFCTLHYHTTVTWLIQAFVAIPIFARCLRLHGSRIFFYVFDLLFVARWCFHVFGARYVPDFASLLRWFFFFLWISRFDFSFFALFVVRRSPSTFAILLLAVFILVLHFVLFWRYCCSFIPICLSHDFVVLHLMGTFGIRWRYSSRSPVVTCIRSSSYRFLFCYVCVPTDFLLRLWRYWSMWFFLRYIDSNSVFVPHVFWRFLVRYDSFESVVVHVVDPSHVLTSPLFIPLRSTFNSLLLICWYVVFGTFVVVYVVLFVGVLISWYRFYFAMFPVGAHTLLFCCWFLDVPFGYVLPLFVLFCIPRFFFFVCDLFVPVCCLHFAIIRCCCSVTLICSLIHLICLLRHSRYLFAIPTFTFVRLHGDLRLFDSYRLLFTFLTLFDLIPRCWFCIRYVCCLRCPTRLICLFCIPVCVTDSSFVRWISVRYIRWSIRFWSLLFVFCSVVPNFPTFVPLICSLSPFCCSTFTVVVCCCSVYVTLHSSMILWISRSDLVDSVIVTCCWSFGDFARFALCILFILFDFVCSDFLDAEFTAHSFSCDESFVASYRFLFVLFNICLRRLLYDIHVHALLFILCLLRCYYISFSHFLLDML